MSEADYKTIASRILRSTRHRTHQTLSQVSVKACVSLGYLSEVERCAKQPTGDRLMRIATALDYTTPEFLRLIATEIDKKEATK